MTNESTQPASPLPDFTGEFKALFDQVSDAIFIVDLAGRIVEVNEAACQRYGYTRGELLRMTPRDLDTPEQAGFVADRIRAVEERKSMVFETVHIPKSGRRFPVEVHVRLFPHGGQSYLIGVCRDMTERQRAERALRTAERTFREMLENVDLVAIMLDSDGRLAFCNDTLLTLTGWQRHEVIDRDWFTTFLPAEAAGEVRSVFDRMIRSAGSFATRHENEIVTRDGSRRLIFWNNTTLRDPDGTVTGTASLGVDITERKRAEDERLKLEARIRHAQKLESLGLLAGGIAHDFNNLLVAIMGNAGLALLDLRPGVPARAPVEQIERAAQRASDLTKQLLAYAGKGRFAIAPVDLSSHVGEMTQLLQTAVSRSVTLSLDLGDELPAVDADATQIRQVVMNLITNASEAIGSHHGTITMRTGTVDASRRMLQQAYLGESLPEGRYVFLEVSDTGCGMDEETVGRIFDPFFTTKTSGRGLGLATVLGIVRGHRGAMRVSSEPGKGSTFRVLFPASEATRGVGAASQHAVPDPWRGTGMVLVVDDEECVRELAGRMLERLGFEVLTASSGRQAIELFAQHGAAIRVVLLDLSMPGMNGQDTLGRLRARGYRVPVILSSGSVGKDAAAHVDTLGAAAFLDKPYRLDELAVAVRRALGDAPEGRGDQ